MRTVKKR